MAKTSTQKNGITLKQWLPLIGLACAAFVFNMSEFMPVGLLTDIAASFSLTEAEAGIMISVYAWGVMILSMPLMVFATRFDFKRMLLAVVTVFSVGQFLSAFAPTYFFLVFGRIDKVDALLKRACNDGLSVLRACNPLVKIREYLTKAHAAETKPGNLNARVAERGVLHVCHMSSL